MSDGIIGFGLEPVVHLYLNITLLTGDVGYSIFSNVHILAEFIA